MSNTAIVVFSDPKSNSDEALGRLFNALFVTYELKEKGENVVLIFQGAGVRWASEVINEDHPANPLFKAVKDKLIGVCGGCADVFDTDNEIENTDIPLIRQTDIPGTTGIIDLSKYLEDGYRILTF